MSSLSSDHHHLNGRIGPATVGLAASATVRRIHAEERMQAEEYGDPAWPRNLRWALFYDEQCGVPVFPVHGTTGRRCDCGNAQCESPGKHPRTAHGLKDATTDPEQIRKWWMKWPTANLGMP